MPGDTHKAGGLYIHIPFCDGKCGYCAFYSVPYNASAADRYLAALEKDLAGRSTAPETIYIGGGTPTVLRTRQLERLCSALKRHVSFERLKEWTVEANPGSLCAGKLEVLVSAGVNRISLGVQSFNDNALRLLGRRHGANDTAENVAMIREAGVGNLNLDLIACVPGTGRLVWADTLRKAVSLGPEHVSVYALTAEEGTRLAGSVRKGETDMLSDDEQLEELCLAESVLGRAGYSRYEISNYARPEFECLHNLSCWRGYEYVGLGPGAASHVGLERSMNCPDIVLYIEAIERGERVPSETERLTPELKRIERLVFGLRMSEGVEAEIGARSRAKLESLRRDGLVALNGDRWVLTPAGRNLADFVGSELMG